MAETKSCLFARRPPTHTHTPSPSPLLLTLPHPTSTYIFSPFPFPPSLLLQISVNNDQTERGNQKPLMAIAAAVMSVVREAIEANYGVTVDRDFESHPFDNNAYRNTMHDNFVARYDAHGEEGVEHPENGWKAGLESHRDGLLGYSFVLVLNDDFNGGGTKFSNYKTDTGGEVVFSGGVGSFIVFPGWVEHGAVPIQAKLRRSVAMAQRKKGTRVDLRYVLAGFMRTRELHADRPYQPLHHHKDASAILDCVGITEGARDVLLTRLAARDGGM